MIKKQTLTILVVICMMALFATAVSANDVEDATIGIGDGSGYVTIPIVITNSTNIGSVDLTLKYDPSIVIVTGVTGEDMDVTISNLKNNSDGWIRTVSYQANSNGLSDTFVLVNVSFEPVGTTGSCPLEITVTTFSEATPTGNMMPYVVDNGTYTISYVTPSSRSNREGTYPPVPDDDDGSQDENVTEDEPENKTVIETPTAPPLKKLPGIDTDDEDDGGFSWMWLLIVLVVVAVAVGAYLLSKKKNDDEDTTSERADN